MPKAARTVRIEPSHGEAMVYHVESWTNPQKPHRVDLTMHKGNRSCSCTDFGTRRQPAIKGGLPLFTKATSCRHLLVARRYWMMTTLAEIADKLNPGGANE